MKDWKIVGLHMKVELQTINEQGKIEDRMILPQEAQQTLSLLEADIPEEMNKVIWSKIKPSENK